MCTYLSVRTFWQVVISALSIKFFNLNSKRISPGWYEDQRRLSLWNEQQHLFYFTIVPLLNHHTWQCTLLNLIWFGFWYSQSINCMKTKSLSILHWVPWALGVGISYSLSQTFYQSIIFLSTFEVKCLKIAQTSYVAFPLYCRNGKCQSNVPCRGFYLIVQVKFWFLLMYCLRYLRYSSIICKTSFWSQKLAQTRHTNNRRKKNMQRAILLFH